MYINSYKHKGSVFVHINFIVGDTSGHDWNDDINYLKVKKWIVMETELQNVYSSSRILRRNYPQAASTGLVWHISGIDYHAAILYSQCAAALCTVPNTADLHHQNPPNIK